MRAARELLIEGKDDYHVIKNILAKHDLDVSKRHDSLIKIGGYGDEGNYYGRGIDELKRTFAARLNTDNYTHLGIVVDADEDIEGRWKSLCNIAKGVGQIDLPIMPPLNGLVRVLVKEQGPPLRLGFWIMPDNQNAGMLEHFVSEMIDQNSFLWSKAQSDVLHIPPEARLFGKTAEQKAKIYTWLAWQEIPGRPMGIGVTAGWFDHTAPLSQAFVAWAKNLFELE